MFPGLLAASMLGIATAAVPAWEFGNGGEHGGPHHGGPPFGGHGWTTSTTAVSSAQTPFTFPLPNGFPNVQSGSSALRQIEEQAHGTLPNGALPSSLKPGDATIFELIAFNEIFEVAFFSSLIANITNDVAGYEISSPPAKNIVLKTLLAVQAQEELHALGANGILSTSGNTPIQPCSYVFPSNSLDSAIRFASTFTDIVLGVLQDAQAGLAANGDDELLPLLASVIGQEGEQHGYYRTLLDLVPSQLPFLTRCKAQWAYSVLNQNVIVNGSCPNSDIIALPIFGALTVETQNIEPKDQRLMFSFRNNGTSVDDFSLVYVNQQNLPVVVTPTVVGQTDDVVMFNAPFPFTKYLMNGLTFALVTTKASSFASANDVAAATLFGPGLIEID